MSLRWNNFNVRLFQRLRERTPAAKVQAQLRPLPAGLSEPLNLLTGQDSSATDKDSPAIYLRS